MIPEIKGLAKEAGAKISIRALTVKGQLEEVAVTRALDVGFEWAGSSYPPWGIENFDLPLQYWTGKVGDNGQYCGHHATLTVFAPNRGLVSGHEVSKGDYVSCWNSQMSYHEALYACEVTGSSLRIDTCGDTCC